MPEPARQKYLAELDATLPLPADRRSEILEEIAAHLEDAVADRVAAGVPADRAEMAAQDRLGSPRALARELARPDQTAWRLVVAAGSGLRAAVGSWIYGYLLGALISYLVAFAGLATVQLAGQILETRWSFQTVDGGWNSVLTSAAVTLGLYFAGRSAVDAASLAGRRLRDDVRPWVAVIGSAVAWVVLVLVIELPQNWVSVVALIVAPAAVALGAYRPELFPRRPRLSLLVIVGLFLAIPVVGLLTTTAGSEGGTVELADGPSDRGLSVVGPLWEPVWQADGAVLESGGWTTTADGAIRVEWQIVDIAVLAGLSDLRIEAWRSDATVPFAIDSRHERPFATATVQRTDGVLTGEIRTTQTPGVEFWEIVLTGIGPDGERYVVDAGLGGTSTFTGSVWDWITAVLGAD